MARTVLSVLFGVLPALVNKLDAVTVRIRHVGSVVARVIVESGSGSALVRSPRCERRSLSSVDLFSIRYKAHMCVRTEPFEIRVPWRPILAVIIKALVDAERSQRRFIERDRAFDIAYCEKDVVERDP